MSSQCGASLAERALRHEDLGYQKQACGGSAPLPTRKPGHQAVVLLAFTCWLGWWPLFVVTILAGLGAMLSWEKAGRDQIEANFDLCSIVEEDEQNLL